MLPLLALIPLALAVVTDLRRREVPDAIPLLILGLAILQHWVASPPEGWAGSVLGGLVAGVVTAALFFAGGLGGGDVKLLTALGALLGLSATLVLLTFSAIAGGALCLAARRRGVREVPYVPAIAAGYSCVLVLAFVGAS